MYNCEDKNHIIKEVGKPERDIGVELTSCDNCQSLGGCVPDCINCIKVLINAEA